MLVAAFATTASAYIVTSVSATTASSNYGWQTHSARCWNGKGGILSYYNAGARGNPGPGAGTSNLGFELPENGSTGGTDQPGQSWTGTDRYVGTKISDIKKIEYWAIVDWAGNNTTPLVDNNGCAVYHEWRLQSQSSQPPAVVLTVNLNNGGDWRTFVYRPWGTQSAVYGFGPSAVEFNAVGTARLHRIWQKYTAVDYQGGANGCWYCTEAQDEWHPTGMYTWDELVAKYPNATLGTPSVVANPVLRQDPAQAPIPCSFSLHMGAMETNNSDWASVGKDSWWYESYWGRGAADLVTFAYDADPSGGGNIVEETFDFESNPPRPVRELALNNHAVYDQNVYMPGLNPPDELPNRRTRKSPKPTEPLAWGEGTVVLANFNAVQRYGYYGYSGASPNIKGNRFVLYGQICSDPPKVMGANSGWWFYVDDGTGTKVKCYCPQSTYNSDLSEGNYVRMVGSLQGNNPYEWYWNNFHYVNPSMTVMSKPWPWEFQTFPWEVTSIGTP